MRDTARWLALSLSLVVLLGLGASPASADKGVSVDLGVIDVSQKLSRGGRYSLPTIGVRNPGSEASRYMMGISYLEAQSDKRPPADWFDFEPEEFRLGPGETQPVAITLRVPTDARPDSYAALLSAQILPEGKGAQVGAAAGARLQFTVKPSNVLQAWQLKAETFLRDYSPWSYIAPAAVALLAASVWLTRRFSFRLERRA